jgi:hypothetical protein
MYPFCIFLQLLSPIASWAKRQAALGAAFTSGRPRSRSALDGSPLMWLHPEA